MICALAQYNIFYKIIRIDAKWLENNVELTEFKKKAKFNFGQSPTAGQTIITLPFYDFCQNYPYGALHIEFMREGNDSLLRVDLLFIYYKNGIFMYECHTYADRLAMVGST